MSRLHANENERMRVHRSGVRASSTVRHGSDLLPRALPHGLASITEAVASTRTALASRAIAILMQIHYTSGSGPLGRLGGQFLLQLYTNPLQIWLGAVWGGMAVSFYCNSNANP